MKTLKITANDRHFTANLEENATTAALLSQLPLTLPMLNLYNRELTYRFQQALLLTRHTLLAMQLVISPTGHRDTA